MALSCGDAPVKLRQEILYLLPGSSRKMADFKFYLRSQPAALVAHQILLFSKSSPGMHKLKIHRDP
jgi:hypothetical protein